MSDRIFDKDKFCGWIFLEEWYSTYKLVNDSLLFIVQTITVIYVSKKCWNVLGQLSKRLIVFNMALVAL